MSLDRISVTPAFDVGVLVSHSKCELFVPLSNTCTFSTASAFTMPLQVPIPSNLTCTLHVCALTFASDCAHALAACVRLADALALKRDVCLSDLWQYIAAGL